MTEPTDKDRLDWLDSHAFSLLKWPLCEDCCMVYAGREYSGTIREAIDSAMAAEGSSGAPGAFGEGVGK